MDKQFVKGSQQLLSLLGLDVSAQNIYAQGLFQNFKPLIRYLNQAILNCCLGHIQGSNEQFYGLLLIFLGQPARISQEINIGIGCGLPGPPVF